MAANVTSVYLHVVEDVINNVRADFRSEGVDEGVLKELQALWELKMMQSGAIQATSEISLARGGNVPITPVHDLNVPYEATEEYETPTAEMLFPPTPVQTPLSNTVEPVMYQYFPPGPSEPVSIGESEIDDDIKIGRPAPFMQPPAAWMSQKPLGVDVNIAYEEGRDDDDAGIEPPPVTKDFFTLSTGKRKRDDFTSNYMLGNYIPQQDGAGDREHALATSGQNVCNYQKKDYAQWAVQKAIGRGGDPSQIRQERFKFDSAIAKIMGTAYVSSLHSIPQLDGGIDENYDDGFAEEDYNEPGEEEPRSTNDGEPKVAKVEGGESDGSEPPLNEDDDDDLDDLDQGDEEPKTQHLVVAQFEKVTRSKNKWKCILKDGLMHLNRRDHLFAKANGEFEF